MTRLTQISIDGLKGAQGTWDLGPATLVIGPRGSGKTTLIDGVQLLATAKHPTAGPGGRPARRTADILHLASGPTLDVAGTVKSERLEARLQRHWAQVEVGGKITHPKCKTGLVVNGRAIDERRASGKVEDILGEARFVDINELLRAKNREKMIFDLVGSAPWTLERFWAEGGQLGLTRELLDGIWARKEVRSRNFSALNKHWDGQSDLRAWLTRQAEFLHDVSLADHRLIAQLHGAIQRHESKRQGVFDAEARRRAEQALAEAEATQERQREHWARERYAVSQAFAVARQRQQEASQAQADLAKVNEQLEVLEQRNPEAELRALAAQRDGAAERLRQVEERGRALDAQDREHRGNVKKLGEDIERARQGYEEARARVDQGRAWMADKERERTQALAPLAAASKGLRTAIESLSGVVNCGSATCPTCGQLVGQEVLGRLMSQAELAHQDWREATDEWATRLMRGQKRLDVLEGRAGTAQEAVSALVAAQRELQQSHDDQAIERARDEYRAAQDVLRQVEARLNQAQDRARHGWGEEIRQLRARQAQLQERAQFNQNDVYQAEWALSETKKHEQDALGRAKAAVESARKQLEELQELADAERRHVENKIALEEATEHWKASKKAAQALGPKGLQSVLLRSSLAPMVDPVNRCIDGLGLGRFGVRETDDQGRKGLWLGLWHPNGQWAHVETLSGAEFAILSAAILVGLGTLGRAPWKPLLIDGIERLDRELRERFLAHLLGLVREGVVDQILVTGCPDTVAVPEGWTVIEMGRQQRQMAEAA